jgi:hypothetical protein
MKTLITMLALLLAVTLQAQESDNQAESTKSTDLFAESSQEITNELTANHIEVPGTRVRLIPPAGFKFSPALSGFEGPGSDAISVMPNKHGVEAHIAEFKPENLEKKGLTDVRSTRLTINGFIAIYSEATNLNSIYCLMLIGDEYNSITIMATVDKDKKEQLSLVKESLYSVVYEKGPINKDLAVAGFEIDLTGTDLYFDRTFSGVFVFQNKDKKTEDGKKIRSSVIITQVESNPEWLDDLGYFIDVEMRRVKEQADKVEIIAEGKSKIDNLDAMYITAKVEAAGNSSILHLSITGYDQHLFKIQAVTVNDDANFKVLEQIVSTFKVKQ